MRRGKPMKYHGFYCTPELWEAMRKAAIKLDESDSEYIRKAIEQRNNSGQAKATKSTIPEYTTETIEPKRVDTKPSIQEPKEKVREMEGRSQMVQPLLKR